MVEEIRKDEIMRREQVVVIVMLGILVMIFAFESYIFWYGDEHHRAMARMHGVMAPGIFGIGRSLLLSILVAAVLFYYLSRISMREDALSILKTRYAKGGGIQRGLFTNAKGPTQRGLIVM